jgi:acyl-CoA synthetase (AMP-forming)/AMP-acid ligase II
MTEEKLNLIASLEKFAHIQPNKIAFYLLSSKHYLDILESISYETLYQRAKQLAYSLLLEVAPGDRVLLCFPTSIDFTVAFYACLMAKVIAVPVTLPNTVATCKKFERIMTDSNALKVITNRITADALMKSQIIHDNKEMYPQLSAVLNPRVPDKSLFIMDKDNKAHIKLCDYPIKESDIAYLQYTSGSTAEPKGVMISHENLVSNIQHMIHALPIKREEKGLSWLPHTHDMGLVGSILTNIYFGSSLFLVPPIFLLRDPLNWLRALSHYRICASMATNFSLRMCINRFLKKPIQDLDLSALDCLITGSEPISVKECRAFYQMFMPHGFKASSFAISYGLAESTLMVSTRLGLKEIDRNQDKYNTTITRSYLSCGKPVEDLKLINIDTMNECEAEEEGEIWLKGKSIAQGYWGKDGLNLKSFNLHLPDKGIGYFKSGDLGFIKEGELYVTGRLKELIVINGVNYYPEDIEKTVYDMLDNKINAHIVAFSYQDSDLATDSFIILIKTKKQLDETQKLEWALRVKKIILKEHQLVPLDVSFIDFTIPKTTSGKVMRYACRALYEKQKVLENV